MKILADTFGIHENALRVRSRRLELLATNIANANTPHFKARDIDFKAVLGRVQTDAINTTNARHFATSPQEAPADGTRYRVPFNSSVDGNTVEMSVEQAQFGKAATDYRTSLMFIQDRASSLKRALRGE